MIGIAPPNKRMQAARAKAIWYGHSMLTGVDKVPLLGRGNAREPDAGRWATLALRLRPASVAFCIRSALRSTDTRLGDHLKSYARRSSGAACDDRSVQPS